MTNNKDHLPIFPSRANYVAILQSINGARKGFNLLKKKHDALEVTIRQLKADSALIFSNIKPKLKDAYMSLSYCRFTSASLSAVVLDQPVSASTYLIIGNEKHVGISIPTLQLVIRNKGKLPLTGLGRGGEAVNTARNNFQIVLSQMIAIAALEYSMTILHEAKKKNNMRMNGIEYVVLPQLANTEIYMRNELEEIERENFYRLKCSRATQQQLRDKFANVIEDREREKGLTKIGNYGFENYFDIDEFNETKVLFRPSIRETIEVPKKVRKRSTKPPERRKRDPLWEFWTYSSSYLLDVPRPIEPEKKKRHVRRKKPKPTTENALAQTEFQDFSQNF